MKTLYLVILFVFTHSIVQSQELIETEGALLIGNTDNTPQEGTIRYNESDFEGWNGDCWISLTTGECNSVTDSDGNVYDIVEIGTQQWTTQNLRACTYENGDPILYVPGSQSSIYDGVYNWYNNDSTTYNVPYGKLYNWYAANDSRNICPTNWHVATEIDWTILSSYLGGTSISGGEMKETGTAHWDSPNTGATNSAGLTTLPYGWKYISYYAFAGESGFYWTATSHSTNLGRFIRMYHNSDNLQIGQNEKRIGMAVRCVKD